jgi:hypothetical protein
VYTDILAMLLVLLAFYLVLWKKYTLSGIVGFMSLLTRTNNIAWFAFLYVFIYVENYGWNLREFPKSLKMTWSYLAGFAVFVVFLVLNGGVALTVKAVQPLGGLYSGNIAYLLFLWTFLFLPLNLANIPKIIRLVTTRWRWILPTGFVAYLVYLLTFHSTNPFNLGRLNYYPRNRLLMAVTHSLALKSAFFIPVAWSALSISVTRLRQKNYYLLYPFIVLSLIPIWLIEPRYSFVPLAFFLLFKEEQSSLVEGLTIALYIVVCIALLPPIKSQLFFL